MPEIEIPKWCVPPVYTPLFYDDNFAILLYGSRNSAKSDFACLKMLISCLTLPKFKCLMVRRIKDAIKDSVYSMLKECAERNKLDKYFEFKDHLSRIICKINGNSFIPKGTYETLGSTGKAKSVTNPTHAIIDEMDELTESEYKNLVFSLRGAKKKQVIGIFNTNSVDENHWIYKRWFYPTDTFEKKDGSHTYVRSKRRNTTILHTTYLMNPYIDEDIVREFAEEKELDLEDYEVLGLGLIKQRKESNLALKYFKRKDNISDSITFNPNALVYLSWDFNRLPHHTVGVWQFGGYDSSTNQYQWNLVKEFCLEDHSIREVQKEINKWLKSKKYSLRKLAIVCDYSGNTKRDHDSVTDVNKIKQEIKKAKYTVVDKTIVNPSVSASLDFLNDMFGGTVLVDKANPKYGGAKIKLLVHPSCNFHIADFEKTKLDREGKILKITKKDVFMEEGSKVSRTYQARGHAVDGSRYMAASIFNYEYNLHKSNIA